MLALGLCTCWCLAAVADPPSLTAQQIQRLQELVRETQSRDLELKSDLDAKKAEMEAAYGSFALDEEHVRELQQQILELQRAQLSNYHEMQVELRKIVDKERFVTLKQRIDNVLRKRGAKAPPAKRKRSSDEAP